MVEVNFSLTSPIAVSPQLCLDHPMRFAVLSSGSKANSTFVEADGIRFLIDCGLSGRQAEVRLRSLGINPETISAIIVTHEHCDHINGVGTLSRRFKIPVYGNSATLAHLNKLYGREEFTTGLPFTLGNATIHPFSIVHDADDPVGFRIECQGVRLVTLTDLGRVTTLVREMVRGAQAIILESNHDQQMLQDCDYTWELKQRIASTYGHLCNDTAGQLLYDVIHPELFHVVLGHLSENSNTPTLALQAAKHYVDVSAQRASGMKTLLCADVYSTTGLMSCLDPEGGMALAV